MPRSRKLVLRLIAVLFGLLLALGMTEIGLRVARWPGPALRSGRLETHHRSPPSRPDFRDRGNPLAAEKRAGVRRILVVGDSFTWGAGVLAQDAYPDRMQAALDRRARSIETAPKERRRARKKSGEAPPAIPRRRRRRRPRPRTRRTLQTRPMLHSKSSTSADPAGTRPSSSARCAARSTRWRQTSSFSATASTTTSRCAAASSRSCVAASSRASPSRRSRASCSRTARSIASCSSAPTTCACGGRPPTTTTASTPKGSRAGWRLAARWARCTTSPRHTAFRS